MLFTALSALTLASVAAAQTIVDVQVGGSANTQGGVFQFIPANITASNGTIVSFQFSGIPGNHSVTQSTFSNPCQLESGGFDSGWVQILTDPTGVIPVFNLTITDDTKPIWFYCQQLLPSPHCLAGMVGAINAPTTGPNTFAAYQAAAEASKGLPGQNVGNLVGIGASASADVAPVPSAVTLFGQPSPGSATATGSAASGSASATSPATTSASTTPTSAAVSNVAANSLVALLAAALGFAMV